MKVLALFSSIFLPIYVQLFFTLLFIVNIFTTRTNWLSSGVQVGSYKAVATVAGFCLGWYCAADIHMLILWLFLVEYVLVPVKGSLSRIHLFHVT
jgi:hypothetical protein